MKANELMIGDWVRMKENHDVAFQMEDVSGSDMFKRWTSDGEYMIPFSYCEIEPIPITPEILEKNGFNLRENIVVGGPKFVHEQDEGRTEIVIWLQDGMFMEVRKNIYYEDEICYTLPVPFFVHELQHALRLCGIEKKIIL